MKTRMDMEDRLIDFSINIIEICEKLPCHYAAKHLGEELLKAGTKPVISYGEAQRANSSQDYHQKMKSCVKDLYESLILLKILHKKEYYPKELIKHTLNENLQLTELFAENVNRLNNRQLNVMV